MDLLFCISRSWKDLIVSPNTTVYIAITALALNGHQNTQRIANYWYAFERTNTTKQGYSIYIIETVENIKE